jgi:hypothetical protein
MMTNHILEDKWRVQKALSEQAGGDPRRYIALTHKAAVEAQERYGIELRYVAVEQRSENTDPAPSVLEHNPRR